MQSFSIPIQVRWSDIDSNRHLRHSVYYDYGATARIACFSNHGLTNMRLEEYRIGPIAFREEAIFKREIKFEDKVTVDVEVIKATRDFSRWSVRHQILKDDGTLSAILYLDGAWIDLDKRKLAIPDMYIQKIFDDFPKAAGLCLDRKKFYLIIQESIFRSLEDSVCTPTHELCPKLIR